MLSSEEISDYKIDCSGFRGAGEDPDNPLKTLVGGARLELATSCL